jgi:PAS domain-containing protein
VGPEKTGKKKYHPPTLTEVTADRWQFPLHEEPLPDTLGLEPRAKAPSSSEDDCRIVLSVEGKFKRVSEGFCGMLGYQASELLGRPIDDVTVSRTVNIPQHLGVVVHFANFQSLWMFVHRNGGAILVRNTWEMLPDLSIGIVCQPLIARG